MVRKLYQGSLNGSRKGESGMNDKERLEHIKRKVEALKFVGDSEGIAEVNVMLIHNDMMWLIELAEKAEKLVKEFEDVKFTLSVSKGTLDEYADEIKELEQELKQANEKIERYEKSLKDIAINCNTVPFNYIAKQALEGDTQ
jgi:DNA repair exonuclease SbcCD ATPase subunit